MQAASSHKETAYSIQGNHAHHSPILHQQRRTYNTSKSHTIKQEYAVTDEYLAIFALFMSTYARI